MDPRGYRGAGRAGRCGLPHVAERIHRASGIAEQRSNSRAGSIHLFAGTSHLKRPAARRGRRGRHAKPGMSCSKRSRSSRIPKSGRQKSLPVPPSLPFPNVRLNVCGPTKRACRGCRHSSSGREGRPGRSVRSGLPMRRARAADNRRVDAPRRGRHVTESRGAQLLAEERRRNDAARRGNVDRGSSRIRASKAGAPKVEALVDRDRVRLRMWRMAAREVRRAAGVSSVCRAAAAQARLPARPRPRSAGRHGSPLPQPQRLRRTRSDQRRAIAATIECQRLVPGRPAAEPSSSVGRQQRFQERIHPVAVESTQKKGARRSSQINTPEAPKAALERIQLLAETKLRPSSNMP